MRTRTTLTTSPGKAPTADPAASGSGEQWSPALALPVEPELPSRWRKPAITALAVGVIVAGLYAGFRINEWGSDFDPAMNRDIGSSTEG